MLFRNGLTAGLLILGLAGGAQAGDVEKIRAALTKSFPNLKIKEIRPSPVAGLYEFEADAQLFYVSADGKHLVVGDVIEHGSRTNLTEQRREGLVSTVLDTMGDKNMIVMGPKKAKRTLTVFTDVDCPYCAKLHLDVPELTAAGVRVRYLLYPRAGVGSPTYKRSVSVWCAKDRVKAVGVAKAGGEIENKTCDNPVDEHMALGQRLQINGTPTLFTDDGKRIGGYVPASQLLGALGLKAGAAPTAAR